MEYQMVEFLLFVFWLNETSVMALILKSFESRQIVVIEANTILVYWGFLRCNFIQLFYSDRKLIDECFGIFFGFPWTDFN